MSASRLRDWIAYYNVEPWGDHWRTFANAYAAAGVGSCASGRQQRVSAFIPSLEPKQQTVEEMMAIFDRGIKNSGYKFIDG